MGLFDRGLGFAEASELVPGDTVVQAGDVRTIVEVKRVGRDWPYFRFVGADRWISWQVCGRDESRPLRLPASPEVIAPHFRVERIVPPIPAHHNASRGWLRWAVVCTVTGGRFSARRTRDEAQQQADMFGAQHCW